MTAFYIGDLGRRKEEGGSGETGGRRSNAYSGHGGTTSHWIWRYERVLGRDFLHFLLLSSQCAILLYHYSHRCVVIRLLLLLVRQRLIIHYFFVCGNLHSEGIERDAQE